MRPAVFKKITDGIIKLKDINGNTVFLKKDEYITGFYEILFGLPGLKFEYFKDSSKNIDNTIEVIDNVYNIVNTPSKEQLNNVTRQTHDIIIAPQSDTSKEQLNDVTQQNSKQSEEIISSNLEEPPDNPNANKNCQKCHGKGKYKFGGTYGGPIHWSVCECVMFKQNQDIQSNSSIKGFDPETIKMLKSKTQRDWMFMKKEEIKKIMDNAGIDYSQIKDERMALYKFLFSIIKNLP